MIVVKRRPACRAAFCALMLLIVAGCEDHNTRVWRVHHYAARGDKQKVESLLRGNSALVHATNNDHDRQTPLHSAAEAGQATTSELLLDRGAKIEATNFLKMTPLHLAAAEGHTAVVKLLLKRGANVEAEDSGDNRPLLVAASYGHAETVRALLDHDADVDAANGNGFTPLHLAAKWGYAPTVRVLLERGAKVDTRNKDGATPLSSAKDPEVIRLLEQRHQ